MVHLSRRRKSRVLNKSRRKSLHKSSKSRCKKSSNYKKKSTSALGLRNYQDNI